LFEETGLAMAVDDFTILSGPHVCVPLPVGKCKFVSVCSASAHVRYVTGNLRTPTKVEQSIFSQSTVQPNGTCEVPA
jgi:hypothetical protein